MIKAIAISASLLGLSVAGAFGLSQAHSAAMSFGVKVDDEQVATYSDVTPVRAEPQAKLATPKTDIIVVPVPVPRLVVQSSKPTLPKVDVASIAPESVLVLDADGLVAKSPRPKARSASIVVPSYASLDAATPAPRVTHKKVARPKKKVTKARKSAETVRRYASSSSHSAWVPATPQSRVVPNFLSGVYR